MGAEDEKQRLLRLVLRVAQMQLEKGGFATFGAVLGSKRDAQLLTPKSMKQGVTRDELEEYWFRELAKHSIKEGCQAVCFCADVRVPREGGELLPGILVHIELAEGGAEDMLYPYRRNEDSKIELGEPTGDEVPRRCFRPAERG